MILQALNDYYHRLADDEEQDIAPYGFRPQNISFCIVLSREGKLVHVQDLRNNDGGNVRPRRLRVPYLQTRTSGDWANFLWDNTGYVLGCDSGTKADKLKKRFGLFVELHRKMLARCDDEGLALVCRFLEDWSPSRCAELPNWDEVRDAQLVFGLQGEEGFIHDRPILRQLWVEQVAEVVETQPGVSLLSDKAGEMATMHPAIQGVSGCAPTGAMIVSFNTPAFTSYGCSGNNMNAPITPGEAFEYTTALNHLLRERSRRVQVADMTTVFWTAKPTAAELAVPGLFAGPLPQQAEDNEQLAGVRAFLDSLKQGRVDDSLASRDEPDTPFFVLGLSPNRTRIAIRLWLVSTVGDLHRKLADHVARVTIAGSDGRTPLVRELLRETAREAKDIPPLLAGSLMRAILTDAPYPDGFYQAIFRRIRADRRMNATRAAAVKAVLMRNFRKEITVSMDPESPEPAYHLGRWFALLEKTQKDALGERINSTIKDRFFTAASATPAAVFPRLIQLSQHHLRKMAQAGLTGLCVTREKQVQGIAQRLARFPRRLDLQEQGLFYLGYYHQTQDLYTSKQDKDSASEIERE
jgi:CRISPR-associated protein Csd1